MVNVNATACAKVNPIINVKFIEFLLDHFISYCAIWSGFCFRGRSNAYGIITRLNNGIIEVYWRFKKRSQSSDQVPAAYIIAE